jgi:hypothetical protein
MRLDIKDPSRAVLRDAVEPCLRALGHDSRGIVRRERVGSQEGKAARAAVAGALLLNIVAAHNESLTNPLQAVAG